MRKLWILLAGLASLSLTAQVEKKFMPLFPEAELKKPHVFADSYTVPDDFVDGQWQGIIAASNGRTYFSVSSHSADHNAQFYCYDPKLDKVVHLIDVGKWCGETDSIGKINTQGKIHSEIFEVDAKLYCTTTAGHFSEKRPYQGGHFLSYDLQTGGFKNLGRYPDQAGGLLTMTYDPKYRRLYAISQGNQTLVYYDLKTGKITKVGQAEKNPHQTRFLLPDKAGRIYGSTWNGQIYRYDPRARKFSVLKTRLPHDPRIKPPDPTPERLAKTTFSSQELPWHSTHWTRLTWDPKTKWYYGIRGNDEYLFRLRLPKRGGSKAKVKGLTSMSFKRGTRDKNRYGSLSVTRLGRRIYYCSYPVWRSMAHLLSYNIDTGEVSNHGPIVTDGRRRVAEIHSMRPGADGTLHAVAFVWSVKGEDPANSWAGRASCYFHPRFLKINPKRHFK